MAASTQQEGYNDPPLAMASGRVQESMFPFYHQAQKAESYVLLPEKDGGPTLGTLFLPILPDLLK